MRCGCRSVVVKLRLCTFRMLLVQAAVQWPAGAKQGRGGLEQDLSRWDWHFMPHEQQPQQHSAFQ